MAEWLIDEDPELLAATLSLVEAWDDGGDERSSSCSGSASGGDPDALQAPRTAASSSSKTRSRQINVARERRKRELRLLREESARLEAQLFALQQRRELMLRPHYSGKAICTTAPVWESLARHQWQARKKSVAANAKLRAKMADQAVVAHQLMLAIQAALESQPVQEKACRLRVPIDVSLKLSEEQQLQRLEDIFPRWQWALSLSPKFRRGELQFRDYKVVKRGAESATLDLYTSFLLPYSVTSVADVLWSSFQEESRGEADGDEVDKLVQEQRRPDDLIIAVFRIDTTMGGATERQGTLHGKWVAKQQHVPGSNQQLNATQWHYEMTGFGNELDGATVLEDTWQRIVDAKDIGHTHLTGPLAVMQHVRRVRIDFNRSYRVDVRHVKTVTDLFIKQIEADLEYGARGLENALMAQARGC